MTLRLRFLDLETNVLIGDTFVEKCSVVFALAKSAEWSTQLASTLAVVQDLEKGQKVQIFWQGRQILEGKLQSFDDKLADQGIVSLEGRDMLDDLYDAPAFSMAFFENVLFTQALMTLLASAGWQLGDVSTLPDADTSLVTIDLRSEERLLPQIAKLIDTEPKISYRYGGMADGVHLLDVGYFGDDSGLRFYTPPQDDVIPNSGDGLVGPEDIIGYIDELSFKTTLEEIIWGMEAYGGNVIDENDVTRTISLYDAMRSAVSTFRDHAQFPIRENIPRAKYTTWDVTRVPYPGGTIQFHDTDTYTGFQHLGNPSGVDANLNRAWAFWFYPMPGRLKEISVPLSNDSAGGAINDNIDVWLYEGGVYPDADNNATLLYRGTLGTWVSDKVLRHVVPEGTDVILEAGTEYAIVVSFVSNGYAVSTWRGILHNAVGSTTALTWRTSLNNDFFDGTGAWGTSLVCNCPIEIITEPVGDIPGALIVHQESKFAPPQTGAAASASRVQNCGRTLWKWAIRFLQDHEPERTSYKMKPVGEVDIPRIGDAIGVYGQAVGTVVDPYTDSVQTLIKRVDKDALRVDELRLDFSKDKLEMDFSLTEGNGLTNLDLFVTVYDTANKPKPLEGDVNLRSFYTYSSTTSSGVAVGNADPDTTLADGRPARTFDFSFPSIPAGKSKMWLLFVPFGTAPRAALTVELERRPDIDTSTPVRVKVCVGQGWQYDDTASLTIGYLWY